MRHNARSPHSQGGFSLIEMLLALGLVIMVAGLALVGVRRDNETAQARAVGEQMKMVGAALNTYIATRYSTLVTHTPGIDDMPCTNTSNCGTAADPGPRTCTLIGAGPGRVCTITAETLRRNSLVPNSFSGRNPFGSQYLFEIQITGSDPNWIINGIAATADPYTTGGTVRYDLLGEAMLAAGADSGMTQALATRADGYNGAWAETGYGIINKLGLLAYRGGYSSNAYAAYLRRDGSTPMTGNLDMDGHDINNVVNIDAAGDVVAGGTVQAANLRATADQPNALIFGDGVAADRATIGTSTVAGTPILALRHANRVRVENMAGAVGALEAGAATVQSLAANTSIVSSGTLTVVGDTRLNGQVWVGNGTSSYATGVGGITANGRVRSLNSMVAPIIYAGGDNANTSFSPCTLAAPCSRLQASGLYLNHVDGGAAANLRGFELNAATGTISTANSGDLNVTGDLHAFGTARAGALTVDNSVNIGGGAIVFNPALGGVAAYAACSAQRTVTHLSDGTLAQCMNGLWTPMGGIGETLRVISPTIICTVVNGQGGPSVATCPAAYPILSGGGHEFTSGAPRAAPISSYQNGNTWVIYTGATNAYSDTGTFATQSSCFRAMATCARR